MRIFSLIILLTTVTAAHAQSQVPLPKRANLPEKAPKFVDLEAYDANGNVIDTGHDDPKNDPSVGMRYQLKKSIPQLKLLEPQFALTHIVKMNPDGFNFQAILEKQPERFNLFKIHENRYQPQSKYGPTFVNSDAEYKGISDRKYGYCWGYSTLIRNLTVLAFFDPHSNEAIPDKDSDFDAWFDFYRKKMDLLANGNATVIPGFKNLREFTLVPEFEAYFKIVAMGLWKTRAVNFSSIPLFYRSTKMMSYPEVDSLLENLETRLSRGELPKLIFTAWITKKVLGGATDVHSVLATKVERLPNNRARIYLWDIDFYTETLKRAPKYLEISDDHLIFYEPWREPQKPYAFYSTIISRVSIAPENDTETARLLNSLEHFCMESENTHYCTHNQED